MAFICGVCVCVDKYFFLSMHTFFKYITHIVIFL